MIVYLFNIYVLEIYGHICYNFTLHILLYILYVIGDHANNTNNSMWRDEKINAEKRHVTEELEFQKYLKTFLHTNASTTVINTSSTSNSTSNNEVETEDELERKKQALLDMLF